MPFRRVSLRVAALLSSVAVGSSVCVGLKAQTREPGSGMVVGQVVDASSVPVPDARVRLAPWGMPETPGAPGGRVITDGQGRYFFADLPAGKYYIEADKDGYARGAFGRRRPDGPTGYLELGSGERRIDVTLTIWKFAVIAGIVLDEAGEPVVGAGVRALPRLVEGGRVSFDNRELQGPYSAITDDRGQFRLANLQPGTYVVLVPSALTTMPIATVDAAAQDRVFRSGLSSSGLMDLGAPGQPGAVQVGDVAVLNMTRVVTPPGLAGGSIQVYRAVYYPSAATAAEATPISVASGAERTDIIIRMQPSSAVRVAGQLVKPDGTAPPPMAIKLLGKTGDGVVNATIASGSGLPVAMYDTAAAMSDASGRFTMLGVPPGEYVIKQARTILYPAVSQGTGYWIAQPLSVGTTDIDDVIVELKPAVRRFN